MSLAQLKKNREELLRKLQEDSKKAEEKNNTNRQDDDRFWYPTVGSDGNGSAIIRFLPACEGEEIPKVSFFQHAFKNEDTGKWYIEKSRTSLGPKEKDPVGLHNNKLWKQGEEGQKQASKQKRKEIIISNIYVIRDPGNPENEGKVFLYKYGPKINEKISAVMLPDEDLGEEGFNPFDLWNGANFSLKVKTVKNFRNYDDSKFAKQSQLDTDEKMEEIYSQCYPLKPFIDPDSFKSFEELEERLSDVMGWNETPKQQTKSTEVERIEKELKTTVESKNNLTEDDLSDIDDLLKDINLDD